MIQNKLNRKKGKTSGWASLTWNNKEWSGWYSSASNISGASSCWTCSSSLSGTWSCSTALASTWHCGNNEFTSWWLEERHCGPLCWFITKVAANVVQSHCSTTLGPCDRDQPHKAGNYHLKRRKGWEMLNRCKNKSSTFFFSFFFFFFIAFQFSRDWFFNNFF